MNYLGQPILPFTPNWTAAITRSVTFDLRETALGFGAEYFTPLATYTANGWDLTVLLRSAADLLAWESFCDGLVGRLKGFWLPTPLAAAQFVAGVSASEFDVVWEDLTTTWNARPDQFLFFIYPDGSQRAATISGVADNGDGTERVTLVDKLTETPPVGTVVQRLHFVRFANDEETFEFLAENVARVRVTVIELPLEYTVAATGLQPIYLYDIYADAPVGIHWRYTSFAAAVASNGALFAPWAMNHDAISQSTDGQDRSVNVSAQPDAAHPFSLLAGMPPGQTIGVDIYMVQLAAPDAPLKIFSGFISTVTDDGVKYTAKCLSRLAWLATKLPRFYLGSACNHILYDPATCRASRVENETVVTFQAVVAGDLPMIWVTFDMSFDLGNRQSNNWYAGGWIESSVGTSYEVRTVIASGWNGAQLVLTLSAPLRVAQPGGKLQLIAGCDHTAATCAGKFGNFNNFGGFPAIPDRNLVLEGLNTSVSSGNKK